MLLPVCVLEQFVAVRAGSREDVVQQLLASIVLRRLHRQRPAKESPKTVDREMDETVIYVRPDGPKTYAHTITRQDPRKISPDYVRKNPDFGIRKNPDLGFRKNAQNLSSAFYR